MSDPTNRPAPAAPRVPKGRRSEWTVSATRPTTTTIHQVPRRGTARDRANRTDAAAVAPISGGDDACPEPTSRACPTATHPAAAKALEPAISIINHHRRPNAATPSETPRTMTVPIAAGNATSQDPPSEGWNQGLTPTPLAMSNHAPVASTPPSSEPTTSRGNRRRWPVDGARRAARSEERRVGVLLDEAPLGCTELARSLITTRCPWWSSRGPYFRDARCACRNGVAHAPEEVLRTDHRGQSCGLESVCRRPLQSSNGQGDVALNKGSMEFLKHLDP